MSKDIYADVTDRIIHQLEQGVIPWHKPWIGSNLAISHSTGKPYSLLNQLILNRGGEYLTFNQVKQAGGKVKKGAKAGMVVFWKWLEKEDENDPEKKRQIPYLKYFNVFHIDDCEGVDRKYTQENPCTCEPVEAADAIITGYLNRSGVKLNHESGGRAFYSPSSDAVTLPLMDQFLDVSEYYSTAFHELTHSTGHESRLNRLSKTAHFGNEEYSKEELVAEIGAATLVNHVGLETSSSLTNSAAYCQSWLKALQNDKRMIVSAAGKAEKAVKLILGEEDSAA